MAFSSSTRARLPEGVCDPIVRPQPGTDNAATPGFQPGPIQQAYLVGDQDGLELRSPARYYLSCEIELRYVHDLQQRLDRLVRAHPILRMRVDDDLTPTPIVVDPVIPVEVWETTEDTFDATDIKVRDEFRSDELEFEAWPQLRIAVVRSPGQAKVHVVYAMWLMDAASLNHFLSGLVAPDSNVDSMDNTPRVVVPRQRMRERERERDERYWRAVAPTLPDAAEVPLRPGWRQSSRVISHRMLHFDAVVAETISIHGRRHGLTVPMIYLTVYGALLGAAAGGASHTVTVLQSQRNRLEENDTIGNYGRTVPLAIPALEEHGFVNLARLVQSRFLEQSFHASLSGAEIARLGDNSADVQRLPYPFAFTAVETDSQREVASGLQRDWDSVQLRVPQVLLDHQVIMDADGSVRLGFDWRADAFDEGFVNDLIDRYSRTIAELADAGADWTRPRESAIPTIAGPLTNSSGEATLHERVMESVTRTPDAIAVCDDEGVLTYAMVAAYASGVAQQLVSAGATVGDNVGVHLSRGRHQVVAILGILLAGCVYVPLDVSLPDGRLDRITRQANLRYAVTDGDPTVDDRWRQRGTLPVGVSSMGRPCEVVHRGSPATAYVIFTSGSTGEPKGVVIQHEAALNTIDTVNDILGLAPIDTVLSVSSIGFDLSVYDIFGPLLVGATVVMLSEATARTPAAWSRAITEHGVTIWNSAPSLASLLAEEGGTFPIRAFLLSGDWIPLHLPTALQRLSADAEVISLGGATEGSIWSIYHRIEPEDRTGRSIPYGKSLANQDILILDPQRQECPDWNIGEIYIAGAGVADGYLNDPAKTAIAFVNDPRYGWIYRTGDRGRRAPNGVVEFLGRVDSQVKVNGHRVELGEIESSLNATDYVHSSAACVADDSRGVVAYLTLKPDAKASWREDVMDVLRNELPSYMVPYALIELDELPLTSNGKIDHRRLRSTRSAREIATAEHLPQVETGLHIQEVSACWAQILDRPAGSENFFDAGGSSYDAIRLLSLLRSSLGYEIPFGKFVSNPTAPGLATMCATARPMDDPAVWILSPRSVTNPRIRVVFFPPVGGGVSCYSELIRNLPVDVEVYAIGFDRPLDAWTDPGPTVTDLAAACLQTLPIEIAETTVPCVFVGWSFGGALAFEAAGRTLHPVTRVVVVDTPVTASSRRCVDDESAMIAGFIEDIRGSSNVNIDVDQVGADIVLRNRFEVYRQNMLALRNWEPQALTVPLIEFRASVRPAESNPLAWQEFSKSGNTFVLNGGHFDMFKKENANRLRDKIEGGAL